MFISYGMVISIYRGAAMASQVNILAYCISEANADWLGFLEKCFIHD